MKIYKYPTESSGRVTILISVAKVLNWEHKDKLSMVMATLNNQIGLFIDKKKGSLNLNGDTYELKEVDENKTDSKE